MPPDEAMMGMGSAQPAGGPSPQMMQQLMAARGAGASPPPHAAAGPTPASAPTANQGQAAAGVAIIGVIVKLMERAIPLLGAGSEAGQALVKGLSSLSKHAPLGGMSPGVEAAELQKLQMQQRAGAPAALAQQAAAHPPMGAPAAPPPT